MERRVIGRCWALGLVVLLAGCDSWEDKCERSCEYAKKCADEGCTDTEIEHCGDVLEEAGEDCQEAFDDWVECVDEHENDCEDIDEECNDEGFQVLVECEGEFD